MKLISCLCVWYSVMSFICWWFFFIIFSWCGEVSALYCSINSLWQRRWFLSFIHVFPTTLRPYFLECLYIFGYNIYVWKQLYLLYYYYSLIVSWILLVAVYVYDEWIELLFIWWIEWMEWTRIMMNEWIDRIIVYMMNEWNRQEI